MPILPARSRPLSDENRSCRLAGATQCLSLVATHRPQLREHRLVYIGNAAQSLHPVPDRASTWACRDCVCLADSLARASADPIVALSRYEAARNADPIRDLALHRCIAGLVCLPANGYRNGAVDRADRFRPGLSLRRSLSSVLMFGVRR